MCVLMSVCVRVDVTVGCMPGVCKAGRDEQGYREKIL